jgi:hypothetical protein
MKQLNFSVGTSDFKQIVDTKATLVDKTLFIKEIMENNSSVILITRPRRFGKTINMSMLSYFLKMGQGDIFQGLKIKDHPEFCARHQNKYSVIFLTFKDIKPATFEDAMTDLRGLFQKLYGKYLDLLDGEVLPEYSKQYFNKIINEEIQDPSLLARGLSNLMEYLHKKHGIPPIVLLDEYDTIIQEAYIKGYYDQMLSFMRALLGSALKDNVDLGKAVLTGITRVSQESLFSGLNNLDVYTVLDKGYGEYFGFTEEEVASLLPDNVDLEPIKRWYNGYNISGFKLYNPWSIASYFKHDQTLGIYWISTSDNALVYKFMESRFDLREEFEELIAGHKTEQLLSKSLTFPSLETSMDTVWTLLIHTGYLHVTSSVQDRTGKERAMVSIPNVEIRGIFIEMLELWFTPKNKGWKHYREFIQKFVDGDASTFIQRVQHYIETMSYFDFDHREPEKVYHSFMNGLLVGLEETHIVTSNGEAGKGRYDIRIAPRDKKHRGFLLEFKTSPNEESMEESAVQALEQIMKKEYTQGLEAGEILCIGMAFCGKKVVGKHTIMEGNS